jgi:hypothetical protein
MKYAFLNTILICLAVQLVAQENGEEFYPRDEPYPAPVSYYDCNPRRCVQQDSWLQDVNGDTRLDIITKKRTIRSNSGRLKIKTYVRLMQEDGTFKKSRKTLVDEKDYQMQKLR